MIEISNVSYRYSRKMQIAFPDLRAEKGEHCLLLGESGSGKTTLLHLMGGLLRGYEGSIRIDRTELGTLSESGLDRFRGKNIGFIFQKNHLIQALNVEKNLALSPFLAGVALDKMKVHAVAEELDLGSKLKSPVSELSHGQAQRVAIARAVLNEPSVILADEPTSALDDKNCERVIHLLKNVAAHHNATLIIATHDHRLKPFIEKQIHLPS